MLTDTTALVVAYIVYAVCTILIIVRLYATWTRSRQWKEDDYWMILALVILTTHAVAAVLVLEYKTSNVDYPERLPPEEVRRRELGSKLVILTRTCYAVFIWTMKFCVLSFYSRLVEQLRHYQRFISPIWWLLVATFTGSILSTYLECRPFNHYWQVVPDPGHQCTYSEGQLYTTGACNLFTDIVLLGFILPIIWRLNLPLRTKLHIASLFSLGIIVMIITIIRLPFVVRNQALQQWRTMFANVEILASCIVTNAPVLYRIIKDRRQFGLQVSSSMTPSTTLHPQNPYRSEFFFSANRSPMQMRRSDGSRSEFTASGDSIEFVARVLTHGDVDVEKVGYHREFSDTRETIRA
ncbi:hypothetical protein K440DRAFT_165678 [Wilcoxina mikolae CBS 423.85]|nr:hypothetical protein K440DRAFT_165678 [Wilcoxina mikolae CBS 423.85]